MNQGWDQNSVSLISLIGAVGWASISFAPTALAQQIQPDTTLGSAQSTILHNGVNTHNKTGDLITGGARWDNNLFHSFKEFNVNENQGVYFNSAGGITRIFARITGNNTSEILGTLGVWDQLNNRIGTADLFFINPHGILFGRNSSLDLGGSFISSTASNIVFADGREFSASYPANSSLLTVTIPIGLQFRNGGGDIQVLSSNLSVEGGRTLAIIGGKVTLDQGAFIHSGSINDVKGRVELGGVGANERADLQALPTGWALNYEQVQSFADIQLRGSAMVSAVGSSDLGIGEIQIQGKNISLLNGSQINNPNFGVYPGGEILIRASETLSIGGVGSDQRPSGLSSNNLSLGQGGNIKIIAHNLNLFDGAFISSQAEKSSSGRAGNLILAVMESIEMRDSLLSTSPYGLKSGGDITITTKDLKILDGSEISASTGGRGRGGNISINANSIRLSGFSAETGSSSIIDVQSQEGATGLGGSLTINTDRLRISEGALINATTSSHARGGDILVNTDTLALINGGQISSSTLSRGEAGNIAINANHSIILLGQDNTFHKRLHQFGQENISNIGAASGLFAQGDAAGTAGNIIIKTGQMNISNGAKVSVSSPQGQAGNLTISAHSLTLNRGTLTAETGKSGGESGANITLQLSNLLKLENESLISATASGDANGGNLTIDSPFVVAFPPTGRNGSDITANAARGNGGSININAQGIFGIAEGLAFRGDQSNDIDASSEFGASGQVQINSTLDPNRGIIQLPESVVDPNDLITQNPCRRGNKSQFVRTGRGGLPPSSQEDLSSLATQIELVEPALTQTGELGHRDASERTKTSSSSTIAISTIAISIVPTQGWIFNEQGEVVLVAYDPSTRSPQRLRTNPEGCPVG